MFSHRQTIYTLACAFWLGTANLSPASESGDKTQTSPREVGEVEEPTSQSAYPMDKPVEMGKGGRKAGEIDLYLGPSLTNKIGAGLGFNASLFTQQASASNFGLKYGGGVGGGFYLGSSQFPGMQPEVVGTAKMGFGYYDVSGLKNSVGPHALLDFLMLNATYVGNVETLLSYTPSLEFGLHGRSAATHTFWTLQLEPGANLAYIQGALQKISSTGQKQNSLIAPTATVRFFIDTKLTSQMHLRFSTFVTDTLDVLGNGQGSRHLFQLTAFALAKWGSWFYTGPQFFYFIPQKVANFSTGTYVPGVSQYTVSWLIGGALSGL